METARTVCVDSIGLIGVTGVMTDLAAFVEGAAILYGAASGGKSSGSENLGIAESGVDVLVLRDVSLFNGDAGKIFAVSSVETAVLLDLPSSTPRDPKVNKMVS